jgi:hypothetical protein
MEKFLSIKLAVSENLEIPKLHAIPRPMPASPSRTVEKPANIFSVLDDQEDTHYKSEFVEDLSDMFVKKSGRRKR